MNLRNGTSGLLLDRVRAADLVSADLTPADVTRTRLMCGVVFAGSVHTTPDQRPLLARRCLATLLHGLRRA